MLFANAFPFDEFKVLSLGKKQMHFLLTSLKFCRLEKRFDISFNIINPLLSLVQVCRRRYVIRHVRMGAYVWDEIYAAVRRASPGEPVITVSCWFYFLVITGRKRMEPGNGK